MSEQDSSFDDWGEADQADLERDYRPESAGDRSGDAPEPATISRTVLEDVRADLEARSTSAFPGPVEPSRIDDSFFEFEPLERYRPVDWAWVNEPYAFVVILYDDSIDEYRYRAIEPALDRFEAYVREDLERALRSELLYADVDDERPRRVLFDEEGERIVRANASAVPPVSIHKIWYYLRRDFLGYDRIDPLMRDPEIEDISCNGDGLPIHAYHREYRNLETGRQFEAEELDAYARRLAQRAGRNLSTSKPLVDARLPDGSRVQATLGGEVTTRGSNFTIRNFSETPFTPIDLVDLGTFSVEQMAFLWFVIQHDRSLLFAGETGSGKTTSMNSVSFFIPPQSKIVSIEDTPELTLPHDNWIQSVTRDPIGAEGSGEVTMYDLLEAGLRQRPEYLVVGEIRAEPRVASTFFQAISTGHTAYTTFHADSIRGLLSRMQNDPLNVPGQMIAELDLVSIQKQVQHDGKRVRRNSQIAEIQPQPDDLNALRTRPVFEYDPATDEFERAESSQVLTDVADEQGWSNDRITRELSRRREVLSYLLEHDIDGYDEVARTINSFVRHPDIVLERIRDETFDPLELPTSMGG